jgi:DNA-binding response OmpR family regulator
MMAALLQDCGYGVLTAGSVAEGLDLAKEINFDLYILDIRLPDGTGVQLCQRLRELNPKIPILYYSAYGDEADHQNALETCGDAYLKKPVCIADIQETIAELLKKAEADG